jgi:quercetin dioxygenase-like cupin family protein
MSSRTRTLALALGAAIAGSPLLAGAQSPEVRRETLQVLAFPGPALHTLTMRVTLAPGAVVAPHTHPGIEMAYVAGGVGEVQIAASGPRALVVGDSFAAPPRTVHSVRNSGKTPLVLVSTYVVDANDPLARPAP